MTTATPDAAHTTATTVPPHAFRDLDVRSAFATQPEAPAGATGQMTVPPQTPQQQDSPQAKLQRYRAWKQECGGDEGAAAALCDYIAEGGHLPGFCREKGFSYTTVRHWIEDNPTRAAMYARAREERSDVLADDILSISEEDCSYPITDKEGNQIGTAVDSAKVKQLALRIDSRKWMAAKMKPRVYGEKLSLDGNLNLTESRPEDLIKRIGALDPTIAQAAARALGVTVAIGAAQPVTDVEARRAPGQ